jgi:hypothetical protein
MSICYHVIIMFVFCIYICIYGGRCGRNVETENKKLSYSYYYYISAVKPPRATTYYNIIAKQIICCFNDIPFFR